MSAIAVQAAAGTTQAVAGGGVAGIEAYQLPDLDQRRRLFGFLELSYTGGVAYKDGEDYAGRPLLIEHENEFVALGGGTGVFNEIVANTDRPPSTEEQKRGRYYRRKRVAFYENHHKPILDKVAAYVVRNSPKRYEGAKPDFDRLQIDKVMGEYLHTGLKCTEAWLGFDTVALPDIPEGGTPYSEAQVAVLDPKHKGKPYFVQADARRIVDFEQQEDGRVTRVVIREEAYAKSSFTEKATCTVRFKEWTDTDWVVYELVEGSGTEILAAPGIDVALKVREVERKTHNFGVCPWYRYTPEFMTVDLAEMSRALFNMNSLLDEELYKNTFTQTWITGAKGADITTGSSKGSGNILAIDSPEAAVGTFGAITDQAKSLIDRCHYIRESMYELVSMENSRSKNVAEAAEKKKRDLESLYTMLLRIVKDLEEIENRVLTDMGVIEPTKTDSLTIYDRKFDVNSVQELLDELKDIGDRTMCPPSFKRAVMLQALAKMDPWGNHAAYTLEIKGLIDTSPGVIDAVAQLATAGVGIPEIYNRLLGVLPEDAAKVVNAVAQHKAAATALFNDPNGGSNAGDIQAKDGAGGGGSSGAPGASAAAA